MIRAVLTDPVLVARLLAARFHEAPDEARVVLNAAPDRAVHEIALVLEVHVVDRVLAALGAGLEALGAGLEAHDVGLEALGIGAEVVPVHLVDVEVMIGGEQMMTGGET